MLSKFWKENKEPLKFIFLAFLIWQLGIALLSGVSNLVLSERKGFVYSEKEKKNPIFLWDRANFDGIHYLEISRNNGYGLYQQAFFPLYPKLIRFLTPVFAGQDVLAAVFISNFSLLVALFFLYKLIVCDYSEKVAHSSLIFFLLFPASFFLNAVYTESLFLALVLGSFYAVRKNQWLWAGILGGLASYTRIVGIFIFPALLFEWFQQTKAKKSRRKIRNLAFVFLSPLGLLWQMRFLWLKYQDPLMFAHVQANFGVGRSGGKLVLLYQVFWRYWKMILTTKLDPSYFTVWLELLTALSFLLLIVLAFRKKIRASYLIFTSFSFLLPTLSGTFCSLPRFALGFFPAFILMGMLKNKALRIVLYSVFGFLLSASAILFFQGYWIS